MTVARGRLVVAPQAPHEYRLDDLVAEIRPGNVHKEIVTDQRGREAW